MSNTGKNLKIVAIVWEIFLMVGAFVGGLSLLEYSDTVFIGIAVLVGGFLFALVSGLVLYGFGIIVEKVEMDQTEKVKKTHPPMYGKYKPTAPTTEWTCDSCGTKVDSGKYCPTCGDVYKNPMPSASADSWTCTCGKVNPKYLVTCSCGKSAREVREMKN